MSKKEKIVNGIILLVCIIITIVTLNNSGELKEFPEIFRTLKVEYLVIGIIFMAVYIIISGIILTLNIRSLGKNVNWINGIFISIVGLYYSFITPFASGGQPFQIYQMNRKYGLSVGKGTSVTMQKCVIYQIVVPTMIVIDFILNYKLLKNTFPKYIAVIDVSIILNILGTVITFIALYKAKWLIKVVNIIADWLKKFRIFKNLKTNKIVKEINEYDSIMKEMQNKKMLSLKVSILTILQMIFYFSISYFVFKSLNVNNVSYLIMFSLQILVYTVVSYIPTPGNAGASESGFYIIYSAFVNNGVIAFAMICWRVITYYIPLLVSGFVVFCEYFTNKNIIEET